ncbi:LysR family transcriptional regulator [Roseibium marinum]|uniref:DNA-binding transcriptional LysR family regulator n=1 Tax=Roseibium marinum TaxID=281252 RepID=A0A2S3V2W9_9HYPH|nr:LysR family transcriptional regulator [Roseibium marinum]POF34288.1 DNA-binding transcriptional LysR family regulator [Roseibium marinum]
MRHIQTLVLIEAVSKAGSIRKAAEDMNITSSALNRRIQGFEEEFGAPIFERLPRGVRLNPAGELLIQHIRGQLADLDRVRSQVADLSGLRRGHVSIACSQALQPYFMPSQIAAYRAEHPGVSFSVRVRDREAAEEDLRAFQGDLALVFEPIHLGDFDVLLTVEQPVFAVMAKDHPLATKDRLRLRDCLVYPHVVPPKRIGIRYLLDLAVSRMTQKMEPIAEADSFEFMRHYVQHEQAVGFQFPIGLNLRGDDRLIFRPLPKSDITYGNLTLMQMKGRTLSVASARFANQLAVALSGNWETL